MAGTFERYNDEEDDVLAPTEPQITSHDPVERKAARSLRIKRRQEALKRFSNINSYLNKILLYF